MKTRRVVYQVMLIVSLALALLAPRPPVAHAATITVNNAGDGTATPGNCPGPNCRLRDAIAKASSGDTINFGGDLTINLVGSALTIAKNLTIDGAGHTVTISGQGAIRVFYVSGSYTVTLNRLTVTNGYVNSQGGGIYNDGGTLNMTNCTVSGNTADNGGGGITNQGTTNIVNGTISGNTGGGLLSFSGTFNVTNSTISGNTGSGIAITDGDLVVTHSTIAGNTDVGIRNDLMFSGSATLKNTIVANNTGGNCMAMFVPFTDGGYNLVWGDTTCPGTNADPKLLALADNGGPTQTMALDNGSKALEQIPSGTNGCGTTYTTDQRGYVRPGTRNQPTNKCEIGAWEAQTADPTAVTLRDFRAAPVFDLAAWWAKLLREWRH